MASIPPCCSSAAAIAPYLLMDCGPGELFIVRNVGNLVPPHDASAGSHGTGAAVEFGVLKLGVRHIVVCGHSHCGAIHALYDDPVPETPHMNGWLALARDAAVPGVASPDALRCAEQRSIVIQLGRLMGYPMVAARVEQGTLFLHGWHYLIEDGCILVPDVTSGRFVAADPPPASPALDTLQ